MEATKPIQQAFGSPGGKSYLAPRIVALMPPHKTYVEPFAGAAAVYFNKEPSSKEILSDKDTDIAFAFQFLRDMTPSQFARLKRYKWTRDRATFNRLRKAKPKSDIDRFYQFYYLRKSSYASSETSYNPRVEGQPIDISRLWKVHERLQRTKTQVHSTDATGLISKYDSPATFFYLDPPYPSRSFVGQSFKDWTEDDLKKLVDKLKGIKGKFALSLSTEHAKLLPKSWHIQRVKVRRNITSGYGDFQPAYQYEIIATNYDPKRELARPHIEIVPTKLEQRRVPDNGHKRVPVGVFTDKKGARLARRYHRGWRRVPAA